MRPCTPHYVLGAVPTIIHGRHFYVSSTIQDTCAGIIHTFTISYKVTNKRYSDTRNLLRRLLAMWLDYYQEDRQDTNTCFTLLALCLISLSCYGSDGFHQGTHS
jgi:hypothetical protein